jgi:creatinine amidohydrolase
VTVRFAEHNWRQVARRLESDCRVVIPLGATEQHGDLSLTSDTNFIERLTHAACTAAGVLMTPAVPFGCSAFAATFPGSISMRTRTMALVIEDLVDCLYRQGFRRLVFVTGHGGNEAITGVLSEVMLDRPCLVIDYLNGWRGMTDTIRRIERERGLPRTEHAAWHEALAFNVVAPVAEQVYPQSADPDFPGFPLNPRTARHYMSDGVQAGLSVLPDEKLMQEMFDACVADLTVTLRTIPATIPER